MTPCPESSRIQDWLDGDLPAAEARAFAAHLDGCARCAAEVSAFRRVWADLAALPQWDPSPELIERVLAEVLPEHAPAWARALGWAYAASLGLALGALAAAIALPEPRAWARGLAGEAAHAVVGATVFVARAVSDSAWRALDALGAARLLGARLAVLAHALAGPLSHPAVQVAVWAALAASAALLWWMRPRERRSPGGIGHAGLLGL